MRSVDIGAIHSNSGGSGEGASATDIGGGGGGVAVGGCSQSCYIVRVTAGSHDVSVVSVRVTFLVHHHQ